MPGAQASPQEASCLLRREKPLAAGSTTRAISKPSPALPGTRCPPPTPNSSLGRCPGSPCPPHNQGERSPGTGARETALDTLIPKAGLVRSGTGTTQGRGRFCCPSCLRLPPQTPGLRLGCGSEPGRGWGHIVKGHERVPTLFYKRDTDPLGQQEAEAQPRSLRSDIRARPGPPSSGLSRDPAPLMWVRDVVLIPALRHHTHYFGSPPRARAEPSNGGSVPSPNPPIRVPRSGLPASPLHR